MATEGSGKGEADSPRAAFKQKVDLARQQIDRSHVHRKSSLSNVVAHSLADFDPTALRVICVVNGLAHAMYGFTTWRNQWGQTTHLLVWHVALIFLSSGLSVTMLVVLCIPGRVRLYVARYYQELCTLWMVLVFGVNVTYRVINEHRRIRSPSIWAPQVNFSISGGPRPSINCTNADPWASAWANTPNFDSEATGCETGLASGRVLAVQVVYIMVLLPLGSRPRWAAVTSVLDVALFCTGLVFVGAELGDGREMAMAVLLLVTTACFVVFLADVRHTNAHARWVAMRKVSDVVERHRIFLHTLVPERVLHDDNKAWCSTSRESSQRSIQAGEGVRSVSVQEEGTGNLVLHPLTDILVMFCALPDMDVMTGWGVRGEGVSGEGRERAEGAACSTEMVFGYMNKIFSLFDSEVMRAGMYKYQHIQETFVVVSSAAALEERDLKSFDIRAELAGMVVLADRFNDILARFPPPWLGVGAAIKVRCGIQVGSLTGAVVGRKKRFYCLFGDAMNAAARLCRSDVTANTPDAPATPTGIMCSADIAELIRRRGADAGPPAGRDAAVHRPPPAATGTQTSEAERPCALRAQAGAPKGEAGSSDEIAVPESPAVAVLPGIAQERVSVVPGIPWYEADKSEGGGGTIDLTLMSLGMHEFEDQGRIELFLLRGHRVKEQEGRCFGPKGHNGQVGQESFGAAHLSISSAAGRAADDEETWSRLLNDQGRAGLAVFSDFKSPAVARRIIYGSHSTLNTTSRPRRLKGQNVGGGLMMRKEPLPWKIGTEQDGAFACSKWSLEFVNPRVQEKYESHIETHRGVLLFYGVCFCLIMTMFQWFALLQLERLGATVGAHGRHDMDPESAKARQLTVGLFGAVFASLFMLALASGCLCLLLCLPVVPPTPASLTPISRRSFVALSHALYVRKRQQCELEETKPAIKRVQTWTRSANSHTSSGRRSWRQSLSRDPHDVVQLEVDQILEDKLGSWGQNLFPDGDNWRRMAERDRDCVQPLPLRVLCWGLLAVKGGYLLSCIGLYFATNADGWLLSFTLALTTIHACGNGLSAKQNVILNLTSSVAIALVAVFRHLGAAGHNIPRIIMYLVYTHIGTICARLEDHWARSRWIMEAVMKQELERLRQSLEDLLPQNFIELVLGTTDASLPLTKTVTRNSAVLNLNVINYTSLTTSVPSSALARHMHALFSEIDAAVSDTRCVSLDVFKMDTIGDSYVAAAWLAESEMPGASTVNADVCECLLQLADVMVGILQRYNESHGTNFQCRVGIDGGRVSAGIQGLLQPRFHLLGPAVQGAERLQSQAQVGTVNVSIAVQRMLDDTADVGGVTSDALILPV